MHGKDKDMKGKKMPKGGPALALVISVGPPMKAKRKAATNATKKRKESKSRK